ncbi:MAG: hypothetical protein HY282_16100 [Nitrospirae bacterium]|nr:hypothetical protein [Candidatus Manganitrophaceae bacterium]
MLEKFPEEERAIHRMTTEGRTWRNGSVFRPLSRLERLKFGLMALLALTIFIGVLISAFFIGLMLAIPLTLLWMAWLARIAWRLRMRSRLQRF